MKYNKLVRDKITEIMTRKGKIQTTHVADDKEYWGKLKEKLREEVEEFLKDESEEELVDILEVINSICDFKNIRGENLEDMRKRKAQERGGFRKRIILDEVKDQ